jgi:hypothetical protein
MKLKIKNTYQFYFANKNKCVYMWIFLIELILIPMWCGCRDKGCSNPMCANWSAEQIAATRRQEAFNAAGVRVAPPRRSFYGERLGQG